MNLRFDSGFEKDIKRIRDRSLKLRIENTIEHLERAKSLQEISILKKLKGEKNYYRIRIGDYRMGFRFVHDTIIIERFLHRKEIYKFYPPQ